MVRTVQQLEDRLSRPSPTLIDDLAGLDGDIMVLGAAGKLGPSLVRLAVRAIEQGGSGAQVIAVSRFSAPHSQEAMRSTGATVLAADISDDTDLGRLPDAANVVYLVGAKFGTQGNEPHTWVTNTYLPGRVAERYRRSRIVALSTGNVYPLTNPSIGGPAETDPVAPVGEYGMSCLGRERVLTYFAHRYNTPTALIRLNYAVEPRYGVLVDIARRVRDHEPVDVTMGFVNVIWQGYANEVILRSLLHANVPPFLLNLTGAETESVRRLATEFGRALGTEVKITGTEAETALLANAGRCRDLFGPTDVGIDELITIIAQWLDAGLPLLDKPTKFESRNGRF